MAVRRAVLFDVDGTLIDALAGQRRIWHDWAVQFGLDPLLVYETALRTRPVDTVVELLPGHPPAPLVAAFDRLEDVDAVHGDVRRIAGASALLDALEPGGWALVTSNAEHRVAARFRRLGLPMPAVVIDNAATRLGKPSPDPFLLAASRLGVEPGACLVVEDSPSGVTAGIAAGMTVWSVNGEDVVPGAHRHYSALIDAVDDICDFVAADAIRAPSGTHGR